MPNLRRKFFKLKGKNDCLNQIHYNYKFYFTTIISTLSENPILYMSDTTFKTNQIQSHINCYIKKYRI